MKNINILFGFIVVFLFLSMPLFCMTETVDVLESLIKKASYTAERLDHLVSLVEKCKDEDPQKAGKYGKQALRILHDFPDDKVKVKVLNGICWASGLSGKYYEALDMGRQAETLARRINDKKGLAEALSSIANVYLYLSDFNKALDYALKAKEESEALGHRKCHASALVSIARVHRNLNEYEKALFNYKKAMEILQQLGNKGDVAMMFNNMANVYWYKKKYHKALDYYSQGLEMMKNLERERGIALLMFNIARVYNETGKYRQALQNDREALKIYEKLGDKGGIADVLRGLGQDYGRLKEYAKAFDYLDESLNMATKLGRKDITRNIYTEYTHIYEAMGDYKNALFYHKKFKEISDKILNEDSRKRIDHLQVVYDVEKKEKENQLELDRQKLLRNFLALVSVLVIIIALATYNRYRIKKKAEQALRLSEQKLKKMNAAKDRLFTIIAHDLGSPLNSLLLSSAHLKNHFQSLDEQDLKEFIHNIYRQTRDMADLLENLLQWAMVRIGKMEQNPETLDLRLLADETVEQVKFMAQKKKIHLVSHIMEDTPAWADKHMMKAVMRNLLSNAVKYTPPGGEIKITSKDTGNRVEITVSDNGVGIDKEKKERLFKEEIHESTRGTIKEKGTGLGLVLCKEFVEKNGGEIRVQSQPDRGSHFSFTLPRHR